MIVLLACLDNFIPTMHPNNAPSVNQAACRRPRQLMSDIPAISKMVAFLFLDMRRALSLSAGAASSWVLLSRRLSVSFRKSRRDSSSASLFSLGGFANLCSAAEQAEQAEVSCTQQCH